MLSGVMECSDARGRSPGTCSGGVCSPTTASGRQEAAAAAAESRGLARPRAHAPSITNFCIEEILKPSFGRKLSGSARCSAFTPLHVTAGHPERHQAAPPRDTPCYVYPVTAKIGATVTSSSTSSSSSSSSSSSGTCSPPAAKDDPDAEKVIRSSDGSREGREKEVDVLWPAWVYCTRYSDRPSSGPRSRKIKRHDRHVDEKRPRTAFTNEQLSALKREFDENRYLTEERRQRLASELKLNESQIKIWFQNKRAKMKKASGQRNGLALQLMAQGLYNHSTIPVPEDGTDDVIKAS